MSKREAHEAMLRKIEKEVVFGSMAPSPKDIAWLIAELWATYAAKDMADGCLHEIGVTLEALGCGCGEDSLAATPPMNYPEWIACVVRAHVKKALEDAK